MSTSQENPADDINELFSYLKPEKFIRGATPANIKDRCLDLCRTYIGGSWNNANSVDDIEVTRITGGISNQLYRVQLKDSVEKTKNVIYPENPTDVIIKLYLEKRLLSYHKDDSERLNDTIILTIMSQTGLGPKVYGIFNDGVIQAYAKHTKFSINLMNDPQIIRSIAHTLAKVHHLNVPIRKEPYWNVKQSRKSLEAAFKTQPVNQLIEELNLETFATFDICKELKWLESTVNSLKCPLVFCHHDFLGNNILVTEPNNDIILIDLEYCTYGSRGYDIAVFMSQWDLKSNDYGNFDMPEDEIMIQFIKLYIEGADLIEPGYKLKSENSVDSILYEVKLFMAVYFMFWITYTLNQHDSLIEAIPFDIKANYKYAESYYKKYHIFKKRMGHN